MNNSVIECEAPNEILYNFQGNILIPEQGESAIFGLSIDQLLLRGSSLKNTEYIYGVVIYTGHQTKIMKNNVKSKAKFSKLEKSTNRYILLMMLIQIIICTAAAVYGLMWTENDS